MSAMRKVASYLGFVEEEEEQHVRGREARDAYEVHDDEFGADDYDGFEEEDRPVVQSAPATVSPSPRPAR